uniref:Uncharacterized protein n=1 Tax=Magallana gigas TaxID=29159 RepID=A0A8W8K5B8_MAGGI
MGSVVGNWTAEEAMQSSTWRELETVNRVMKRLGVQSHINKAVTDSGVSLDSKLGTFSEHMCGINALSNGLFMCLKNKPGVSLLGALQCN